MNNLYGNFTNVDETEVSSLLKNTIHDNVVLSSVKYENTDKSGEALIYTFQKKIDKNSLGVFSARVLPLKKWDNQSDEEFKLSVTEWNANIKHIASKYDITLEELTNETSNATSFSDFCNKYIKLLSSKLDDRKLYLKLFSNKGGYAALPKYPKYIQKMSTGDCILSFTNYEKNKMIEWDGESVGNDDIVEVDDIDI